MSLLNNIFGVEHERRLALAAGMVVPEGERCIQCGICSYCCPVGIDVRAYAWRNLPLSDAECIRCGECVLRCPRGTLRILAAGERAPVEPAPDVLPRMPVEA